VTNDTKNNKAQDEKATDTLADAATDAAAGSADAAVATTNDDADVIDMDADAPLNKVMLYAFDEARQKLEQGSDVEPFTVILAGEELYVESHPGDDIVECFNSARKTMFEMDLLADAYVFCYDGYVQLDEGARDALIVERAEKTAEVGEAFALLYTMDEEGDGSIEFEDAIFGLGEAPSLFGAGEFDVELLEGFDAELSEALGDQSDDGACCADSSCCCGEPDKAFDKMSDNKANNA